MRRTLPALLALTLAATAATAAGPAFEQQPFGKIPASKDKKGKDVPAQPVTQYTLINKNNVVVKCIEYGAIVTEIRVPDRDGKFADVALGFDDLDGYLKGHPYFGANAGRSANRIAKGKFTLDGKEYKLATNNGANHLHGGEKGFDKKFWRGEPGIGTTGPFVKFTYTSPDGEEGYPGKLSVSLTYTLTDNNELVIDVRATTDKTTVCNIAHHSYFNLAGHNAGPVLGHELEIAAKFYTPADDTLIPTGKIVPVAETPFDFTKRKAIGKDIKKAGGDPVGYDLNYVLDKGQTERAEFAARVTEPKTGRVLEVYTTEPGLQFYTGNFLDGKTIGKGRAYQQYDGFCLEAQKFPDAVNKAEWLKRSNPVLKPDETYKQTTTYKFGVAK